MSDYMYHLLMRKSTSDYSLMILFNQGLVAMLPLGTTDKLSNPDFPIPVSFVMGENDWVRFADEDYGQQCVDAQKLNKTPGIASHERGNYVFCPGAGHQMHMDNPIGFSHIVINELLGKDLPVKLSGEYPGEE